MSVWGTSEKTKRLYSERAHGKAPEMDCAKQLTELLAPIVEPGMTVLDVGCGAGYFYHSLKRLGLDYYGVDLTEEYIKIGRNNLQKAGLLPDRLQVKGIEDIDGMFDVVICFNVIQHLPVGLELYLRKLSECAKSVIAIRTSLHPTLETVVEYGEPHDDPQNKFMNVTYPQFLFSEIMDKLYWRCSFIEDLKTKGTPEKLYRNHVFIYPLIVVCQKGINT